MKTNNLDSIKRKLYYYPWYPVGEDIKKVLKDAKLREAKKTHYILFILGIGIFAIIIFYFFTIVIFISNLLK